MQKLFVKNLTVVGALWATALMAVPVSAASLDTKGTLVCTAIEVMACTESPGCIEGRASSFDLPQFMFVDFKKKHIRAETEDGKSHVSVIKVLEKSDAHIIMQGIENDRGWSASVDRKSGKLTVASAGSDLSFTIFGACTTL